MKIKNLNYTLSAIFLAVSLSLAGCGRKEEKNIEILNEITGGGTTTESRKQEEQIQEQIESTSTNPVQILDEMSGVDAKKGVVRIDNGRISEEDFTKILYQLQDKSFKDLYILSIENIDLSKFSPETLVLFENTISSMKNLSHLTLQNMNIDDISFLDNAQFKQTLTLLVLSENNISNIDSLSSFTSLENLYLNDNEISDMNALIDLNKLEKLYLDQNNISDISILLDYLPSLHDFSIFYNYLTNKDGIILRQLEEMGVKVSNSSYYQNSPEKVYTKE